MHNVFTPKNLANFDIAAKQQRYHLAQDVQLQSHFANAPHQICLTEIFRSCMPQVVSYLCNYIPIFCMNLSYGTQLCQAAEYLIQLKERQKETIT